MFQRLGHGPLPRQVADHRTGAQHAAILGTDQVLIDRGLKQHPVGALEGDLATGGRSPREGIVGRRPSGRRFGDYVVQPDRAAFQVLVRQAEPVAKRLVGEQEPALGIDRVEPDRRMLQEVDETLLLLSHDLFQLSAQGNVVDHPQDRSGARRDWIGGHVAPFPGPGGGTGGGTAGGFGVAALGPAPRPHRQLGIARHAVARIRHQAVEMIPGLLIAGHLDGEQFGRRFVDAAKEIVERPIREHRAAVPIDDLPRLWNGAEDIILQGVGLAQAADRDQGRETGARHRPGPRPNSPHSSTGTLRHASSRRLGLARRRSDCLSLPYRPDSPSSIHGLNHSRSLRFKPPHSRIPPGALHGRSQGALPGSTQERWAPRRPGNLPLSRIT